MKAIFETRIRTLIAAAILAGISKDWILQIVNDSLHPEAPAA